MGDDLYGIERRLQAISKKKTKTNNYIKYAIVGTAALAMPAVYYADTRLFPVIDKATAVITYDGSETATNVRFVFHKNRACKYLSTSFWLRGPLTREIRLLRSQHPIHFPPGKTSTSFLLLDVPREAFIEHGLVTVEHRCHPFWIHKSVMYE